MSFSDRPGPRYPFAVILNRSYILVIRMLILFFSLTGIHESCFAASLPPGVPDLTHTDTRLTIIVDNSIADNNAANRVQAHIVDSDGNPVPNVVVNFSYSGTGVTVPFSTDAFGNAVFPLTSAVVGQAEITANVAGVQIKPAQKIFVTFVAYVPKVDDSRLEVVTGVAIANGTAVNTVKAVIVDANGNPVPNQSITFQIASGTGTFSGPTTILTNAGGEAIISLTSNTVGNVTITATVNGVPITNGSPAAVAFVTDVPNPAVPTTFLLTVTNNALANGSAKNSVSAHITDINGNSVANQTVVFAIVGTASTPGGILTVTTDASGNAPLEMTSLVAGTVSVSATINGTPIVTGNPQVVTFVADVPSVSPTSNTYLIVVTDNALANNAATNTVRAHVTDANGNPVGNQAVTFSIANGSGTFTGSATINTDINGDAIIAIKSNMVGVVNITAKVNGLDIVTGSPALVHFVADAPNTGVPTTALSGVTNNAAANGSATNSIKAHISDIYGNPVAGQTVVFTIASGTADLASGASYTVVTDVNGEAFLLLTSIVANTVTITATVNGMPIINGSPQAVVFVADAPSAATPTTYLEVVTTNSIANGTDLNTVKAHVADANGNAIANQAVVFAIADGTATPAGLMTVITDANGDAVISFNSTVADTVKITATINNLNITHGSPAPIVFVAGPPDINNSNTALIVVKDGADADGVATNLIKAHIADAFGNPVPGQTVTFALASGTASPAGSLTGTTDANGDVVLTLTSATVGDVTITAILNGTIAIINGSPAEVKFVTYPDVSSDNTYIVVVTDNAVADGSTTNSVRAHIVDNFGNPMAGQLVVFTISSGDGTIITPQPVLTDANGDAVIQLTSVKVGSVELTATVAGRLIIHGSPAKVRFTKDDVWVPRVFTPNGDGVNDLIRPIINGSFRLEYFTIYNRWGNLVFTSTDVNIGWDGRLKGVLQPTETYLWILGGTDGGNRQVKRKGMLSLVR